MSGRLTTHVLNLATGRPAGGVRVSIARLGEQEGRRRIREAVTNDGGRTELTLIQDGELEAGTYELVFDVGSYFRRVSPDSAGFLGLVPVWIAILDAEQDYHVPLLITPWSYTTYRDS